MTSIKPRPLQETLKDRFKRHRIIIIIGSRQVGKTSIMNAYAATIPSTLMQFYFNLEDVDALDACQDIDHLKRHLSSNDADITRDRIFLIIDEFHYIKNATKLLMIFWKQKTILKPDY